MIEREAGMGLVGSAYLRAVQAVGRRLDYGTSIYERDWDVLVVLDACRPDALRTATDAVDHIEAADVGTMRSVGSCSSEWLESTFMTDRNTTAVERTAMVTGNTWTDRYLDADRFALLDEVWKYAWDEELDTVPADAVTDRAIQVARHRDHEQLVVHYMQPHHPFVPDPLDGDSGMARTGAHSSATSPWVLLRRGDVPGERVRAAYDANLRYALSSVETLLDNVDGRVAVTADHANLFGEWGLYGHPMYTPVPALVTVPWSETTAEDRATRDPDLTPPESLPVSRVYDADGDESRLEALGYL
ncbi:MAG: hypothetical protein V5A44_06460 [Haloarculaceae archaeon]